MFDLAFYRSTDPEVGRPVRSTDVHRRARLVWLEGRSTEPVDRQKATLWIWPRSTGRELLLSVSRPRSTGRSTDGTTLRNLTVGRSTGQSTDSRKVAELSPTASFWSLFIWGCFGLFSIRFQESFWASFSYLSQCLSPLVLELKLSYQ